MSAEPTPENTSELSADALAGLWSKRLKEDLSLLNAAGVAAEVVIPALTKYVEDTVETFALQVGGLKAEKVAAIRKGFLDLYGLLGEEQA